MNNQVRIATSVFDLKSFLSETIDKSDFKLKKINISEQSNWSAKDGVLSHFSNGFFQVTGLKNKITERVVSLRKTKCLSRRRGGYWIKF